MKHSHVCKASRTDSHPAHVSSLFLYLFRFPSRRGVDRRKKIQGINRRMGMGVKVKGWKNEKEWLRYGAQRVRKGETAGEEQECSKSPPYIMLTPSSFTRRF